MENWQAACLCQPSENVDTCSQANHPWRSDYFMTSLSFIHFTSNQALHPLDSYQPQMLEEQAITVKLLEPKSLRVLLLPVAWFEKHLNRTYSFPLRYLKSRIPGSGCDYRRATGVKNKNKNKNTRTRNTLGTKETQACEQEMKQLYTYKYLLGPPT